MVITLPHPASMLSNPGDDSTIVRGYGAKGPLGEDEHLTFAHTIGEVFTQFTRANFRVDTVIEPPGEQLVPESLILRARKTGS